MTLLWRRNSYEISNFRPRLSRYISRLIYRSDPGQEEARLQASSCQQTAQVSTKFQLSQAAQNMATASTSPSSFKMIPSPPQLVHKAASEIHAANPTKPRANRVSVNAPCFLYDTVWCFFCSAAIKSETSCHDILRISTLQDPFSPLRSHSQQVVPWLVIRGSLHLNGGTSAGLPVVNWLVQAVTRWGGSRTDHIRFILKAHGLGGKTRSYPLSQSQISPWLNTPFVKPATMSKKRRGKKQYSHVVSFFIQAEKKTQDVCIKRNLNDALKGCISFIQGGKNLKWMQPL